MRFVFRNNTIERFFDATYAFSGYDDISVVPKDAEAYVWFYQSPVKYDQMVLVDEIKGYVEKIGFVLNQIESGKTFIAFTMDCFYSAPLTDDDSRLKTAIAEYNLSLYEFERQHSNVKVIDITEFTRHYSEEELIDWKFYFISQMGMNPKLHKEFKIWFAKKLEGIALKRKKCLVLDLDNTLWGGVLGEDGIDGIKIGGDYPGKAFLYWQESIKQLSKCGVILAVCSKNNEADVFEAWEKNPYNILHKEDFSAWRINWEDKASNIKAIANELNIGLDSFVFIDDNPTERELIRQVLPMVGVPDFPEQPYMLPLFFKKIVFDYFKVYSITEEDKNKTEQYKANAARSQAAASYADFETFLKSLNLQLTIESANEYNIPRIAQMTQKTNQFNLTTKRYTDSDIKGFVSNGWKIWCISVADKFGDNGITGCIMIDGVKIDSLLLSCRILGKGIETAFVKRVLKILKESGVQELEARYIPTAKNSQVKEFWELCGFSCSKEEKFGEKDYLLDLSKADLSIQDYYHITIK